MPWPGLYSGVRAPRGRSSRASEVRRRSASHRPSDPARRGGTAGASAALGRDAGRHHGLRPRPPGARRRALRHRRDPRAPRPGRRRGAARRRASRASPTMLDGQVKTFHHAVYAGHPRAARPARAARGAQARGHRADRPRRRQRPSRSAPRSGGRSIGIDKAIDMIDVGGAALLGAAARNPAGVAAVSSPEHYPQVLAELKERGQVSPELRAQLAAEAFGMVAAYHAEIAAYLNQIAGTTYPKRLAMVLDKVSDLRYGENPHQTGALYRETTHRSAGVADAVPLQGGTPSFNNLLDLDVAYRIAQRLHDADGGHREAHRPGRAGLGGRARRGLPARAGDRSRGVVRRDRRREPGARRGDGARDRGELVRGGDRARLRRLGVRDPAPEERAGAAARPAGPDRGHARLRHRPARLQARRRRPPRRDDGRAGPRRQPAPGRHQAPARRSRS